LSLEKMPPLNERKKEKQGKFQKTLREWKQEPEEKRGETLGFSFVQQVTGKYSTFHRQGVVNREKKKVEKGQGSGRRVSQTQR